jgi:branched-chain amino acid transport system substrate-binding protein
MGIRFVPFFIAIVTTFSAGAAFAASPIKIGGLFAVTGPAAFLGEPERNTAKMVVDEINKAGGVKGHKLELVVYDTSGDATKAVQLATKLIKDDHVTAIIGPSTTGESMAVIPVAEREQVPLISCAAGIKITEPVKKWVFKTAQNDTLAVGRIYEYLQKNKQSKVAILTVSDGFGASGREQLKAQAAKYGISIVSDDTYGPKDQGFQGPGDHLLGHQSRPGAYCEERSPIGHQDAALHEPRCILEEVHRTGRRGCRRDQAPFRQGNRGGYASRIGSPEEVLDGVCQGLPAALPG